VPLQLLALTAPAYTWRIEAGGEDRGGRRGRAGDSPVLTAPAYALSWSPSLSSPALLFASLLLSHSFLHRFLG